MAKSSKTGSAKQSIAQRAKRIRMLLMDVDGVLTDGRIWLQSLPDGTACEIKGFHSQDGVRMKLARAAGLRTGIISGRASAAVERRAKETELEFVFQGRAEKVPAYEEALRATGVTDEEVCYVGDDLPDIPVLERVGLAIAVANACPEAKRAAHYVTRACGGHGAICEVVELILKSQGKWRDLAAKARA